MSHTPDQPDKGYTTGFYDGKQAEQDRIIRLLEADGVNCYCEACWLAKADQHWRYAIELIEGQK